MVMIEAKSAVAFGSTNLSGGIWTDLEVPYDEDNALEFVRTMGMDIFI